MKPTNYLIVLTSLLFVDICTGKESSTPLQPAASRNENQPAAAAPKSVKTPAENLLEQQKIPGLSIGEKAPVFKLKDQNGENRSLADILKSGSAALVFYRSADW